MPVAGDLKAITDLDDAGNAVPVNGPVKSAIKFSGPRGSVLAGSRL